MKLEIKQPVITLFCDTLAALVPECRLIVGESGINALAVDTANVGMVLVNLPNTAFEAFQPGDERTEIGMDVGKWRDMLKVMNDSKSTIAIELVDSGKLRLTDGKYTYTHVLLDINTIKKRPNMPGITLPAAVEVDAAEYAEAIKAMGVVGDKVCLRAIHDHAVLELSAEGDTDHLRKELNVPVPNQSKKDSVRSLFSIDYLRDTAKAMRGAGKIMVHLGENHPVRFDFDLGGMECSFLIAPRIEEE
jgi:proliferating cell nuclear antigen